MTKQQIDDPSKGKYFTQVLNMADDDLGPYEMRLLIHYTRVAWKTGKCWEGIRTTAKITQMSVGMVTKTRNELVKLGYIKVKHRDEDTCVIVIVDRMAENVARYAAHADTDLDEFDAPSGVTRSPGAMGVHETRRGVHVVNTHELDGVHVVNERIIEPKEQEPKKKKKDIAAAHASAHATDLPAQVFDETKVEARKWEQRGQQEIADNIRKYGIAEGYSLEGETAEQPPAKTERKRTTKGTTTPSPQLAAHPPSPSQAGETSKKPRTVAQQANDEAKRIAMNALASAMGVTLVKADEKRYSQIAQSLVSSGITYAEFDQYVKRIRIKAKEQNWDVSVDSLLTKGRPSEYVTAREKWRQDQATRGQGAAQGVGHVLSTIPLKNNAANQGYNPRLDPAYAAQRDQSQQEAMK